MGTVASRGGGAASRTAASDRRETGIASAERIGSRKQGEVFHFAPAILIDIDQLYVRPREVAARHAFAEKKRPLTDYDPVRMDLAEKAYHHPVILSVVLWHPLTRHPSRQRALRALA